ncbi:hypothetical protein FE782_27165 [Paenibacillus antri]|uniref:Uncharacterized protein n=1 Tax=Paenibacillus antri TaxID=2582848 RepID=A0A5R9G7V8_9BACL|nr:hypothetical protein [Paenibacillus antri]TLS49124.1 hypothetical protein FE782_27165 [Paenibacillus antri]
MEQQSFLEDVLQETQQPLRPGVPGKSPFWNKYAKRFVYAPAFDLPLVPGASAYRFTVVGRDGLSRSFHADVPWAPLSPVWNDIPHGLTKLTVEGVDASRENAVANSGEIDFYRAPVFHGPYHEPPPIPYAEAGKRGLRGLFLHSRFQHWLTEGRPDPYMFLNCFASKEIGASIRAMAAYSKLTETKQEVEDAITIARRMADFLIEKAEPPGAPLEHFTPVYWVNPENKIDDWHFRVAVDNVDKMMISEPVRAGFGLLDLYDVTGDATYLEAASRMARTYVKIRREDGTWPLIIERETGAVLEPKPVVPTWILFFFERLGKQYGLAEFADIPGQIAQWLLEHPVEGFHWDSQFEDVKIKVPYRKMAYEQAADTALYLLYNHGGDSEKVRTAEELLRFVEDQFVVWEKPNEGWKTLKFPGGPTKYSQYDVDTWFAPAVIEQFGFVIVARATAVVMRVYAKAYEVTGNAIYLAKARSLANTLVKTQQFHGGGEIPSFPMSSKQITWTNNSVYIALFLLELGSRVDANPAVNNLELSLTGSI